MAYPRRRKLLVTIPEEVHAALSELPGHPNGNAAILIETGLMGKALNAKLVARNTLRDSVQNFLNRLVQYTTVGDTVNVHGRIIQHQIIKSNVGQEHFLCWVEPIPGEKMARKTPLSCFQYKLHGDPRVKIPSMSQEDVRWIRDHRYDIWDAFYRLHLSEAERDAYRIVIDDEE